MPQKLIRITDYGAWVVVFIYLLSITAVLPVPIMAQTSAKAEKETILAISNKLADKISDKPQGLLEMFDRSFFKYVPVEKLEDILRQMYQKYGKVISVNFISKDTANSYKMEFVSEKDFVMPVFLSLDTMNEKITGLFFKPASKKVFSISDIRSKIEKLPGEKGFLLAKLSQGIEIIESLNPDKTFAIGSAFKLYVLGAMLEEDIPWKKVVRLKKEFKSMPSGALLKWPDDSPLTVHTLAIQMISESDNTAADVLVDYLEREDIERNLKNMGHSNPELLKPFLTTSEMFRLKSSTELAGRYINSDIKNRYKILKEELPGIPLNSVKTGINPFMVSEIEWFASPSDMCRLMDYFRKTNDKTAFDIMAINPGLEIPEDKLIYAGYKGGSEPGVLNMTWLLTTQNNVSYCLTASWNNPEDVLNEEKFFEIMQSAINLVAEEKF